MSETTTPYDPIPASIRAEWAAFEAACEAEGFHPGTHLLHAPAGSLLAGEVLVIEGRAVRYWPRCGAVVGLSICAGADEVAP